MSRASLPPKGYVPASRIKEEAPLLVTAVAEGGTANRTFDFSRIPLSPDLQLFFAEGFSRVTGPAGTRRTIPSIEDAFADIMAFARALAESTLVPQSISDLRGSHVDSARLRAGSAWFSARATIRGVFRKQVAPASFMKKLLVATRKAPPASPVHSYTPEHFRLIMREARRAVAAADDRIRRHAQLIDQYRGGHVVDDRKQQAEIAYRSRLVETGDLPRTPRGNPSIAGLRPGSRPSDLMRDLHLSVEECGALTALLVGLTGQNSSQILRLTAVHSRADPQVASSTPVALTRTSKLRRSSNKAEMTIPLSGLPTWITADHDESQLTGVGDRADLRSPFGVYAAALRLCDAARRFENSDSLMLSYSPRRRAVTGVAGFAPASEDDVWAWFLSVNIVDRHGERVAPDTRRLRRTFIEQKQKPVAHSTATFMNTYLLRDRGNIDEYQRVVARVLDAEVTRATESVAKVLTAKNVELARTDLGAAAELAGTTPHTLTSALSGELDTVMTSCVDNDHSPFSPQGSPCTASFMLCLGCPNARAEPRHLPVQLLVLSRLEARRADMEAVEWASKFAQPHARLRHLIAQFPPDTVDAARGTETAADIALVTRFLGRDLDRAS